MQHALTMLKEHKIRTLPVLKKGELVTKIKGLRIGGFKD